VPSDQWRRLEIGDFFTAKFAKEEKLRFGEEFLPRIALNTRMGRGRECRVISEQWKRLEIGDWRLGKRFEPLSSLWKRS